MPVRDPDTDPIAKALLDAFTEYVNPSELPDRRTHYNRRGDTNNLLIWNELMRVRFFEKRKTVLVGGLEYAFYHAYVQVNRNSNAEHPLIKYEIDYNTMVEKNDPAILLTCDDETIRSVTAEIVKGE